MLESLSDLIEKWLQGRINTSVMGLVNRVERLEKEVAELSAAKDKVDEIRNLTEDMRDEVRNVAANLRSRLEAEQPDRDEDIRDVVAIEMEKELEAFVESGSFHDAVHEVVDSLNFRIEVR